MMSLTEFKADFKDRQGIHFNNAGMAPTSNRAAKRAVEVITEFNLHGAIHEKNTLLSLRQARENLANFLGADASEVAYLPNCAAALSQLAFGQKLSPHDTVVTIDQEYSSNFYPWELACERSGAKLVVIHSDEQKQVSMNALIEAIVPGVKCVAVSWVQFQTGALIDLVTLGNHCHKIGAKLIVDGIQGIGQLPISFRDLPIDALVGAAHKWLCSVNGQGFMIVKKDWIPHLDPVVVGAGTFNRFGTIGDLETPMENSARRFESGGLSFTTILALDEAIQLQFDTGIAVIASEISRLSARLRSRLLQFSSRGLTLVTPLAQVGGITSFKIPAEAEARFLASCQAKEMAVIKRGDFVRISLHAFNEDQEVDQVLSLLEIALGETK